MRLLVQRVSQGRVDVAGERVGAVGQGLVVLVGFGAGDGEDAPSRPWWSAMADKLAALRLFADDQGRMNLSLADQGGGLLLVPQFTLYADCRRGRRPSFDGAAPGPAARVLFDRFAADMRARLPGRVECGVFGADMDVTLTNQGPVTVLLDSADFSR